LDFLSFAIEDWDDEGGRDMTDARGTLLDWVDANALAPDKLAGALRVAGATPDVTAWRAFLERLFLWLGAVTAAASVVFFVAANWQALGRFAKFGLVEIALIAAIALAVWRGLDTLPGKAALVVAAMLAGALLALVGQVYQTGADTFELFAAWAVAIVAWVVIARLPALWMLWIAILNCAVIFSRERLLTQGRVVLLELAPVDPRSLMQGDYMALNFRAADGARTGAQSLQFADGKLVLAVDARGVGTFLRLDAGAPLVADEALLRYRIRNGQVKLATNAFFFEEGAGDAYAKARYGEFRVAPDGDAILTGLRDAELAPLGTPPR
jgi:uncharacterized membrane-anchored protein